jgi:hypothetical protein
MKLYLRFLPFHIFFYFITIFNNPKQTQIMALTLMDHDLEEWMPSSLEFDREKISGNAFSQAVLLGKDPDVKLRSSFMANIS